MAFTEAEWKVMKIIWELESCEAKDIYNFAQEKYGWARGTTKSLIFRLCSKGYLKTKQVRNKYIYSPKANIQKEVFAQTSEILEGVFDQTAGDLACRLLKAGELSEQNIEELRSIVDRYKKGKPKNRK